MSSITLHPEFGVNPSVMLCFWCGQSMGVALLGRNKGNEAPRQSVFDYNPCDECRDGMALGITCIEVDSAAQMARPALSGDHAPTGRWTVVTEDAIKCIFTAGDHID